MDGFEKEDRLSSSLASGHQGPQGRAAAGCLHPESHVPGQCVCRQVRELWLALANTGPVGLCLVLGMWCVSVSLVLLSFFSHIFGRHLSQAPISTSPFRHHLHCPSFLLFLYLHPFLCLHPLPCVHN